MAKRKKTIRTTPKKDWKPAFIQELCRTGNISLSADKANISRSHTYLARKEDAAFDAACVEAIEISGEYMEGEARRRAVEGTLRPVFQGGKLVGKVREYSDTLLIFLLKAHNPKYRDTSRMEVAGDPAAPLKHEHALTLTLTVTPADIAAARALLGGPGGDVHRDGGPQPMDPGRGQAAE